MNMRVDGLRLSGNRRRVIVRWLLGVIFLAAGALKITHPGDFYSDLLAYETGWPDGFLRFVALGFPWLEVLCGAALLANVWAETVGFLVSAMSLVFVLMLGQAVGRGLDLHCGCFGIATANWFDDPRLALVRATVLFMASVWWWLRTAADRAEGENPTILPA